MSSWNLRYSEWGALLDLATSMTKPVAANDKALAILERSRWLPLPSRRQGIVTSGSAGRVSFPAAEDPSLDDFDAVDVEESSFSRQLSFDKYPERLALVGNLESLWEVLLNVFDQ